MRTPTTPVVPAVNSNVLCMAFVKRRNEATLRRICNHLQAEPEILRSLTNDDTV